MKIDFVRESVKFVACVCTCRTPMSRGSYDDSGGYQEDGLSIAEDILSLESFHYDGSASCAEILSYFTAVCH